MVEQATCRSCQGKQSITSSLLSPLGRSLILLLGLSIVDSIELLGKVEGVSVGDSIRLLKLMETAVGRGTMVVGVEYHGSLGGIGIVSAMVVGVSNLEAT